MLKRFIFIFIITAAYSTLYAQYHANQLIDSLTFAKNKAEKVRFGSKIAWELKDTDWERTLHYLDYSEKESKESNSDEILAKFYISAGDIYYDKDVLDVALNYYMKAYKLFDENKDRKEYFTLLNGLAIVYARMNNKDKALYYFKRVYEFHKQTNDSVYLAQILNNIGNLYLRENRDSSETYFLKSLQIATKLNDDKLYAYLYTNLVHLYTYYKEDRKVRLYLRKAIAHINTDVDLSTKSLVFQTVSDYFFNIGQNDSAILYAKKTTDLLDEDIYNFSNEKTFSTLYKAYLANKDYKNAAKYFELYDKIRDSINVEEKAVNIERLKLEAEYDKRDQIRTLKENKKKFGYIIIGLSLIFGLFVLLFILARYKTRLSKVQLEKKLIEAKRKELNANLELKNNVLIAKAMVEIHRTEIIQGILEDLKEIKLKAVKKETQHAIDYISKRLEKDTNSNIWKEFELSFEQVHEMFYQNLNKKHPDLTSNDRRLCALLKLNLTSKEISHITGQSFKSVENARTRLRKKLNLTNTKTDLTVYLNSFS